MSPPVLVSLLVSLLALCFACFALGRAYARPILGPSAEDAKMIADRLELETAQVLRALRGNQEALAKLRRLM